MKVLEINRHRLYLRTAFDVSQIKVKMERSQTYVQKNTNKNTLAFSQSDLCVEIAADVLLYASRLQPSTDQRYKFTSIA